MKITKNKHKILIIIILSISVFLLITTQYKKANNSFDSLLITNIISYQQLSNFNVQQNYFIQTVDGYANDDALDILYAHDTIYQNLKEFNLTLNSDFDFYEITFQPLQSLQYFNLDNKFIHRNRNGVIKNQEIVIEGEKCYVTSLSTIQVNNNAYNKFLNSLAKGDSFKAEDFNYENDNIIPIILGNDYLQYYDVGEIIKLNYLQRNIDFKIIGFLNKNTVLTINDFDYVLDTYICMPSFQIKNEFINEEDKTFQIRHYLQKNMGFINVKANKNYEKEIITNYGEIIKNLANKNNLDYSIIVVLQTVISSIS